MCKMLSAGVRVLSFGVHHDVSVFFAACVSPRDLPRTQNVNFLKSAVVDFVLR